MYVTNTGCCGLDVLDDLCRSDWGRAPTPDQHLKDFADNCDQGDDPTTSTVVFTDIDATEYKFGEELRAFIKANKLGSVIATRPVKNLNSGNLVKTYVWRVNVRNFDKKYRPNWRDPYEDDEDL